MVSFDTVSLFKVQWEWQTDSGSWAPYRRAENRFIEVQLTTQIHVYNNTVCCMYMYIVYSCMYMYITLSTHTSLVYVFCFDST